MDLDTREGRQTEVGNWVRICFGASAMSPTERAMRVLEEAIELAQAEGISFERVESAVATVYSRPVGDPVQEAGGVALCLLAWAEGRGHWLHQVERLEIDRVFAKPVKHFRERQAEKAALGMSQPVKPEEIE